MCTSSQGTDRNQEGQLLTGSLGASDQDRRATLLGRTTPLCWTSRRNRTSGNDSPAGCSLIASLLRLGAESGSGNRTGEASRASEARR